MKAAAILSIGLASVLGFAACSSEKKIADPTDETSVGEESASTTADSSDSTDSTDATDESSDDTELTLPGGVTIPDVSIPDVTLPDGATIPDGTIPDVSIDPDDLPANFSEECREYIQAFASAFSGQQAGLEGVAGAFDELGDVVPDDLQDDVEILAEGFTDLQALYEKYDYDYTKILTDPAAQQLFSDTEFTEASANVNTWLEEECESD
jgi:hypothetical protein